MRGEHRLQFYEKQVELLKEEVKELKQENSILSAKNSSLIDKLAEQTEQIEAMRLACTKNERQLADEIYHAEEAKRACEKTYAELVALKIDYMREMDALLNKIKKHQ